MKKVIIFYPPFEGKNILKKRPPFPIGPLYLASYLIKHGIEAEVKDFSYPFVMSKTTCPKNLETSRKMYLRYGNSDKEIKDWLKKNLKNYSEYIGVSSLMSSNYTGAYTLIKLIKEVNPKAVVILGGPHPSTDPEHAANYSGADYICLGEGEEVFRQFLTEKKENEFVLSVKNLKDKIHLNSVSKKAYIKNINLLPFPNRSILLDDRKTEQLYVTFSRGCPHACSYCVSHTIQNRKWRNKKINRIIKEILFYKEQWGVKKFIIEDDNPCPLKEGITFLKKLCKEIIKYSPKTKFSVSHGFPVYASADKELCNLLYKAGFREMAFPLETTSPEVLKDMNKKNTLNNWRKARKLWTYENAPPSLIILGYPFVETIDTMLKTIKDVSEVKSRIWAGWFRLYKGTKLFDRCVKAGYVERNYDSINSQSFFIETERFKIKDLKDLMQITKGVNFAAEEGFDIFNETIESKSFNSFTLPKNIGDVIAKGKFGFNKGQLIAASILLAKTGMLNGKPMTTFNKDKTKIIYTGVQKSNVYSKINQIKK